VFRFSERFSERLSEKFCKMIGASRLFEISFNYASSKSKYAT
jgi:hypothetical protein